MTACIALDGMGKIAHYAAGFFVRQVACYNKNCIFAKENEIT